MGCSKKFVILLALASIAIQYVAIRIFTAKPFQIFLSSMNCSLGQNTEPFDHACDDGPYFAYNASRKTHILILAATRTGSTFMGQLLNQHSDIFYLFEPLHDVDAELIAWLYHNKNVSERQVKLEASRELLRSLYDCDLYSLESYIKPKPVNHTTYGLFGRGASRPLCLPPVCSVPSDVYVEEDGCGKKCGSLNMTLASDSCREHRHVAIKTVRFPGIDDMRALVEDPRLNLKVVQLVRDPRGILSSRIETFPDIYRLWRVWRATGRKPSNLDPARLTMVCENFLNSVSTGLSRPHWLKGKYMLVRYEDLARNTLQKTKEIYEFLGMALDQNVVKWIQKNTRGSKHLSVKDQSGTLRDSAAQAESWRLRLPFEMANYTQNVCQRVLHQLGYKAVKSSEELKNMSVTLIQDRTFVPFL